jgi:hypothetical protein
VLTCSDLPRRSIRVGDAPGSRGGVRRGGGDLLRAGGLLARGRDVPSPRRGRIAHAPQLVRCPAGVLGGGPGVGVATSSLGDVDLGSIGQLARLGVGGGADLLRLVPDGSELLGEVAGVGVRLAELTGDRRRGCRRARPGPLAPRLGGLSAGRAWEGAVPTWWWWWWWWPSCSATPAWRSPGPTPAPARELAAAVEAGAVDY